MTAIRPTAHRTALLRYGHSVTADWPLPRHPATAGVPATPPGQLLAGLTTPPARGSSREHIVPESPPGALTPTALAFPAPNGSAAAEEPPANFPPQSLSANHFTYPPDARATGTGPLPPLPTRDEWLSAEAATVSHLAGPPGAIAAAVAALAARAAAEEAKTSALVGVAIRIKTSLGW